MALLFINDNIHLDGWRTDDDDDVKNKENRRSKKQMVKTDLTTKYIYMHVNQYDSTVVPMKFESIWARTDSNF